MLLLSQHITLCRSYVSRRIGSGPAAPAPDRRRFAPARGGGPCRKPGHTSQQQNSRCVACSVVYLYLLHMYPGFYSYTEGATWKIQDLYGYS